VFVQLAEQGDEVANGGVSWPETVRLRLNTPWIGEMASQHHGR
jgi:hypothetical protein